MLCYHAKKYKKGIRKKEQRAHKKYHSFSHKTILSDYAPPAFSFFPFYLVSLCLCSSALMLRLNKVLSGQTWRTQAFYSCWSDEADTHMSTLTNLRTQKSKEQTHKEKDNVAIRWRCTLFICIPLFSLLIQSLLICSDCLSCFLKYSASLLCCSVVYSTPVVSFPFPSHSTCCLCFCSPFIIFPDWRHFIWWTLNSDINNTHL